MGGLKNPREERFAQAMVLGNTPGLAYLKAMGGELDSRAAVLPPEQLRLWAQRRGVDWLSKRPQIKQRRDEILQEIKDSMVGEETQIRLMTKEIIAECYDRKNYRRALEGLRLLAAIHAQGEAVQHDTKRFEDFLSAVRGEDDDQSE